MKKLYALLYFALILVSNLLPLSLSHASAAAANLIANPSVETADTTNANLPQSWSQGGWGTNTTSFTYPTTGEDGSRGVKVEISGYTSGDAKWYFAPVAITGGAQYTFSDYYESNISSDVVAQFDNGAGSYTYQDLGARAASSTAWALASTNFTAPAAAKNVTIFHLISNVGWLSTDNFSLTSYTAPSAPTVSVTSPTASSTLSGSVQLSANASDGTAVAGVQFKVDGVNVGSEDTTAPYQASWDTTTVSNGTHSITAVARNSSNITTTSTAVQVTVNNSTTAPAGSNLISNPSLETPDSTNPALPVNWSQGGWGTNTTTFTYVTNGGHTGTHSAKIQTTAYTNGDAKWYFAPVAVTAGTQYTFSDYYQSNIASDLMAQFDNGAGTYTYVDLGSQAASATAWKQASVNFTAPTTAKNVTIFHLISGVGTLQTDDASLTASTAPTVAITTPTANANVSGVVQLTASASALAGITSVQFKVDNVNQGAAVTTSPYTLSWDTTKATNGTHSLTAVLTTKDNKTVTSTAVSVNVSNQVAGANLVPNPSLESVNPSNTKLPQSWSNGTWGTNKTTFSYLTTGHTGSHSVKTQITSYTNGASYWYSTPVAVTPGQMYNYSDWYESNITSEVDAGITMNDGTEQDMYIGDVFESPNSWTQFQTQFTVPAGAVSITFYHNIYAVGYVTTDDYSLTTFSYQGFSRPIVSLTFDDGYQSFYTYGLPILQKYGFKSTDYIISGEMTGTDSGYMRAAQVKALYASGQEIGSHTVTHPDLTTLSVTSLDGELKNSQATLQSTLGSGVQVKNFATPYGSANTQVITDAKKYYTTVRGVQAGYNSKNNFNAYNIQVQNMEVTTTLAQVEAWVQQARATNTWLVLTYHQVDPTLTDQTAQPYNTYPSDLDAQLSYIKSTGVTVETMAQAMAEINPQLGH